MKHQSRPFIVEVKQKRGSRKQSGSIWGNLDLSAIAAETARETGPVELTNRHLIDSDVTALDAEDGNQLRAEDLMANPQEAESVQTPTEAPAKAQPAEEKTKVPRAKRVAKAQPKRSAAKEVAKAAISQPVSSAPAKAPRKVYSDKERAQMLSQIEKSIAGGDSIKRASKQAGISEQTYYQWKKATASVPENEDLKGLLALEEENTRLKKLLAERLRKENAELKRKLGLS